MECYFSLKKWKELIGDLPFSQTHRAYLVNLEYITGYYKNIITLITGAKIPITKNYKREFEIEYFNYNTIKKLF